MKFPNIDYSFWLQKWNESIGNKRTYSNIYSRRFLDIDMNLLDCELRINDQIKGFVEETGSLNNVSIIENVVDLIYAWGGRSGRMFYFNKSGLGLPRLLILEEEHLKFYNMGISLAVKADPSALDAFKKVPGIGPSFGSKHAFFWSLQAPNRLIIIDSKICGALGYSNIAELLLQFSYSRIIDDFTNKSKEVFGVNDGSKVERALFAFHNNYFLNSNNGFRRDPLFRVDENEFERLKVILKI
jgi:hypothetical protein